jgi:hypothetical protein
MDVALGKLHDLLVDDTVSALVARPAGSMVCFSGQNKRWMGKRVDSARDRRDAGWIAAAGVDVT